MDGAKLTTDTIDILTDCGRQAFCKGRSILEIGYGLCKNENPGGSRNIVL